MIKYIKYLRILKSLNKFRKFEEGVVEYCKDNKIDYHDLTLRNINKRIDKVKVTWLRRNKID